MKQVAKLVIIDRQGKYLMMYRNEHPVFGVDPDLPGGTAEGDENLLTTMLREVAEEIGVSIDPSLPRHMYTGTDYSKHGTQYSLFVATLTNRPTVTMSWEHSSYEWLSKKEFLAKSKIAKDTYMHMVHDILS